MSSSPKYSILVPSYDPELKTHEEYIKTMVSIDLNSEGQDYELIVRKNGPSYVDSHNDALVTARGDYIVVVTDDVEIRDPDWLHKLTHERALSGWRTFSFHLNDHIHPDFACWSMSRKTFETVGLFDETYSHGVNYEDSDYVERAISLGVPIRDAKVQIDHLEDLTFSTYYLEDRQLLVEANKQRFEAKWL